MKLNRAFSILGRGITERPGTIFSFAIGCSVGLLLRLPLIPWQLGPDASVVFGSGLGALIGAGAAALIATGIANRSERAARATIADVLREPNKALADLLDLEIQEGQPLERYATCVTSLTAAASRAKQRLELLSSSDLYRGGISGLVIVDAALLLQSTLKLLPGLSTLISFGMNGDGRLFRLSPAQRTDFAMQKVELSVLMARLEPGAGRS